MGVIKKFIEKKLQRNYTEIQQKIITITAEQLDVDEDSIKPSHSFVKKLGADSLDVVELIMAFEEEFCIEIPDEIAEKMFTIDDVAKHIADNK